MRRCFPNSRVLASSTPKAPSSTKDTCRAGSSRDPPSAATSCAPRRTRRKACRSMGRCAPTSPTTRSWSSPIRSSIVGAASPGSSSPRCHRAISRICCRRPTLAATARRRSARQISRSFIARRLRTTRPSAVPASRRNSTNTSGINRSAATTSHERRSMASNAPTPFARWSITRSTSSPDSPRPTTWATGGATPSCSRCSLGSSCWSLSWPPGRSTGRACASTNTCARSPPSPTASRPFFGPPPKAFT